MNDYSHMVNNRARQNELSKQAIQVRLANRLDPQRSGAHRLPLAQGVITIIAVLSTTIPWLRRG